MIFSFNVGTVTRNECHPSHGDFRLLDGSRWPYSAVSSRDTALPNVSDSGGNQPGQRILRRGVDAETPTLSTPLRKVMFLKARVTPVTSRIMYPQRAFIVMRAFIPKGCIFLTRQLRFGKAIFTIVIEEFIDSRNSRLRKLQPCLQYLEKILWYADEAISLLLSVL